MEQHCWEKSKILHFTPRAIVSSLSLFLTLLLSLVSVISWLLIILYAPFTAAMCTGFIAHHVKSDCIILPDPALISLLLQSQCLSVCWLHNGATCQEAIKSKTPQADFWLFCFGLGFFCSCVACKKLSRHVNHPNSCVKPIRWSHWLVILPQAESSTLWTVLELILFSNLSCTHP